LVSDCFDLKKNEKKGGYREEREKRKEEKKGR
jgi:hypothetical protein